MNLGVAVSLFNRRITEKMEERALARAKELNVDVVEVIRVPGAFDLPIAVQRLLERDDVDGVATVGAVIKGETDHDDVVCDVASNKLSELSLEYDKPVTLGVAGPGMDKYEAEQRVDYGVRAVEAAVDLYKELDG